MGAQGELRPEITRYGGLRRVARGADPRRRWRDRSKGTSGALLMGAVGAVDVGGPGGGRVIPLPLVEEGFQLNVNKLILKRAVGDSGNHAIH